MESLDFIKNPIRIKSPIKTAITGTNSWQHYRNTSVCTPYNAEAVFSFSDLMIRRINPDNISVNSGICFAVFLTFGLRMEIRGGSWDFAWNVFANIFVLSFGSKLNPQLCLATNN